MDRAPDATPFAWPAARPPCPSRSRAVSSEKFAGAVLPRIPARRWGQIDDFGDIALYLASGASGCTTGEQFIIDGGYTKF
jgi:NAD(P)-dependent dehydrogenase (short-subunit alcohol dehydrogenase family)